MNGVHWANLKNKQRVPLSSAIAQFPTNECKPANANERISLSRANGCQQCTRTNIKERMPRDKCQLTTANGMMYTAECQRSSAKE